MSGNTGLPGSVVVHIVESLGFGGVEKRMETIARASIESKLDHKFWAIGNGGVAADRINSHTRRVWCLRENTKIPNISVIWRLFWMLKELKPLIVHTHGSEANFHGLIAAWLARVPVRIGEEIGIPSHSAKARWVFRQIYRKAHRVVGISDSVRNWLVKSGEVMANRAVRIYNPVELPNDVKSTSGKYPGRFRLGFVGRLEPVKNPIVLVKAVSKLRAAGIPAELRLIGDGSQRKMLEALVVSLRIEEFVEFFGYQENPENYVAECDLYVQPSISEGFGIALVEAMGCSVPVLATAVGGAPEIIKQDHTGWLLSEPSVDQLVVELEIIWRNHSRLTCIGRAGHEAIKTRFAPDRYIEELESLYSYILEEKILGRA